MLKQHCGSPLHLHVVEDDAIFSSFSTRAINIVILTKVIDQFDLLLTDSYMMRRDYRKCEALYAQSLERDATAAVSGVQMRVISYIAATTSYIANRHSISKLVEIFERKLKNGLTEPLDLVIRRATAEGKIRIGCLFPFVTALRIEEIAGSTIAGRNKDFLKTLVLGFGRHSFFVDCDHTALNARAAAALAAHPSHAHGKPASNISAHCQLLDRIPAFLSTDRDPRQAPSHS